MLVSQTTLDDLEWGALRSALAGFAQSPQGKARAQALGFLGSKTVIESELDRVGEAYRLLEMDQRASLHDLFDIEQELGAARRGGTLPGVALLNVASICRTIVSTRTWARSVPEALHRIRAITDELVDCRPLLADLERCLDQNGELLDDASPELKRLRTRALELHDDITAELERMLVKLDDDGYLSDRFVSLRNDRFVIPVKAGSQNEVEGIVHDASQSGFTVFVEPSQIIERGNKLKILRVRITEEEHRILRELSEEVSQDASELRQAIDALTTLDLLFGKASFARRIEAERPQITDTKESLDLEQVRHPLLVLAKTNVVPNDILFGVTERCLVLTGPNTGGKTAALKTVGLVSLMAAAGLYVPARKGSRVPLYKGIYSVIGDNQSLSRALSTFSSHIVEVRGLLDAVSREHKDGEALILLDELAADTDPRLGAALGQAILESMVERGAWVVLTTHYFDLAALAATNPRFANASFGFDPVKLIPTYKLQRGTPGASSPFEIAQNLGLDASIVARAREIAPTMGEGLETLTKLVQVRLDEVQTLKREVETEKHAAERAKAEAVEERRLAHLELKAAEERAVQMLGDDVKKAQTLVKESVRRLQDGLLARNKDDKKEMTTRDAMKMVEDVRQDLTDASNVVSARLPPPPDAVVSAGVRVGDTVTASSLPKDAKVEIIDINHGKLEATVMFGRLKMRLPLADLTPVHDPRQKGRPAPKPKREDEAPKAAGAPVTSSRIDVRGVRVEEALREIDRGLDNAIKESIPQLTISHGHGTNTLKNAIREYLSFSHYVKSYRPGRAGEGEDGVTIVDL